MRKLVYGALALSAALAVGFGVNAADASAEAEITVKTSGTDTMTITPVSGTKKILVGVPSFKADIKAADGRTTDKNKKSIAINTWDVYDGTGRTVTIDLSKYSKTKDNYLAIKSDFQTDAQAIVVKIPKSEVVAPAYDKKTGEVTIGNGSKDSSNKPVLRKNETFNYYTDSHSEGTMSTDADGAVTFAEKAVYQMSGATLYVETQPVTKDTGAVDSTAATKADLVILGATADKNVTIYQADKTTVVQCYTLSPRVSKPGKLNITKLANAPKVTPDFLKGTISLPKGTRATYTQSASGSSLVPGTVTYDNTSSSAATLTLAGAGGSTALAGAGTGTNVKLAGKIDASEPFAIDIYTEAVFNTDGKQTKMPSRMGHYTFDKQYETVNTDGNVTASFAYNTKTKKYDLVITSLNTTEAFAVTAVRKKGDGEESDTSLGKGVSLGKATLTTGETSTVTKKEIKINTKLATKADVQSALEAGLFEVTINKVGDKTAKSWVCTAVKFASTGFVLTRSTPISDTNDPAKLYDLKKLVDSSDAFYAGSSAAAYTAAAGAATPGAITVAKKNDKVVYKLATSVSKNEAEKYKWNGKEMNKDNFIKVGGTGSDKDNVIAFKFIMPAAIVQITKE